MLTDDNYDSFYKNLADNLVYNNYTPIGFGGKNYTNFNIIEFEIISSKTKINDDKLIIPNFLCVYRTWESKAVARDCNQVSEIKFSIKWWKLWKISLKKFRNCIIMKLQLSILIKNPNHFWSGDGNER